MTVVWTPQATHDLAAISAYIALGSPTAANRVANKLIASVFALADTPHIGRIGEVRGTRELIVAPWPLSSFINSTQKSFGLSSFVTLRRSGHKRLTPVPQTLRALVMSGWQELRAIVQLPTQPNSRRPGKVRPRLCAHPAESSHESGSPGRARRWHRSDAQSPPRLR